MNVLIVSASRKVGLIRAFRTAAGTRGGKVIAADADGRSAALYLADSGEVLPRLDAPEFETTLLQVCERHRVGLLVPTRDEELMWFAERRATFRQRGVLVAVSSPDALAKCLDKRAFTAHCAEHGLKTPRALDPRSPGPVPYFQRPYVGKGGKGARRIEDARELEGVDFSANGLYELVEAPEFTLDTFVDDRGKVTSLVPRERVRTFGGESFIGVTRRIPVLMEEGKRLAESLGAFGPLTIQAFLRSDEVLFLEVNPRYGGGSEMGFNAGCPTPEDLVAIAGGEAARDRWDQFVPDRVFLRYTSDVVVEEAALFGEGGVPS